MYYGILDGTDGSNATNDNVNLVSNRSTEGNDWNPEKSDMPNTLAGYTICCQFKLTGLNCSNNAPEISKIIFAVAYIITKCGEEAAACIAGHGNVAVKGPFHA